MAYGNSISNFTATAANGGNITYSVVSETNLNSGSVEVGDIMTINDTGEIIINRSGKFKVRAQEEGGSSIDSGLIIVYKKSVTLEWNEEPQSFAVETQDQYISARVKYSDQVNSNAGTFTYSASNSNVKIWNLGDTNRLLDYKTAGSVTITAELNDNFYSANALEKSIDVLSSSGGNNGGGDNGGDSGLTEQTISFNGTVKTSYVYGDTGDTISVSAYTTVIYSLTDSTGQSTTDVAEIGAYTGQITINKAGSFKVKVQAVASGSFAESNTIISNTITVAKFTGIGLTYATTSIDDTYGNSNFTNALTITGGAPGQDVPVIYESSNTEFATVSSSGEVTIKKPTPAQGSVTITAKLDTTNYEYATGNSDVTYTLTIKKRPVELLYDVTVIDNKEHGDDDFTNALTIKGGVQDGQAVPVTYQSSNTEFATVDSSSGLVQIKKPGSTTITAILSSNDYYEYENGKSDVTYDLTINKKSIELKFDDTSMEKTIGDGKFLNSSFSNGVDGSPRPAVPISFTSSDSSIAIIDSSGYVIIKNSGSVIITASLNSNEYYEYATDKSDVTYNLTINKRPVTLDWKTGKTPSDGQVGDNDQTIEAEILPSGSAGSGIISVGRDGVDLTAGSKTVTLTDTTGIYIVLPVTGPHIPNGTIVEY